MEEQALQQAVETFLQNPTWAEYYDNAPSGAKEVIALEFYGSSSQDAHNDKERKDVLKEVIENLDDEDKEYIAENSPNPNERAFYRKMIDGRGAGATGASGATGATGEANIDIGATGASGVASPEPVASTGASGAVNNATA